MTGGGPGYDVMGGMDVVGSRPRDSHTHVILGVPAVIPAYPLRHSRCPCRHSRCPCRHSRIPTTSFPRRRESSTARVYGDTLPDK